MSENEAGGGGEAFFFYGTLRDLDLLAAVAGEIGTARRAARLAGARVIAAPGEIFPMLIEDTSSVVEGLLVEGLGAEAVARIAFYEGAEYRLEPVTVALEPDGRARARCFRPEPTLMARADPARAANWTLDAWVAGPKAEAVAAAAAVMPLATRLPAGALHRLWGDLVGAAERAQGPRGFGAGLAHGFGAGEVEIASRRRMLEGFFPVDTLTLRHARFGGGVSAALERTVTRVGPVVTLAPYDPVADLVLLIEQWRAGPTAADDPRPWLIELPAGRMDPGESPEAAARREAREEAGVEVGRVETIADYYSSPGATDEHVTSFVGEARLDARHRLGERAYGGLTLGGLADEHEDIRVLIAPLDVALAAAARGEVRNAPTILTLYWLARHRERLASIWAR